MYIPFEKCILYQNQGIVNYHQIRFVEERPLFSVIEKNQKLKSGNVFTYQVKQFYQNINAINKHKIIISLLELLNRKHCWGSTSDSNEIFFGTLLIYFWVDMSLKIFHTVILHYDSSTGDSLQHQEEST